MKKKPKIGLSSSIMIGVGIIILVLVGLNIYYYMNKKNLGFFKASLIDILTFAVGSFIIFLLSERNNNTRRRNDCIEHIITEIETIISDERFFSINRSALLLQASCANKIKYLKDANFPEIAADVAFIETKIQDIRELYSNHSSSEENLKSVIKDFEKKQIDVGDKCDKIRVLLYMK